jgi:hypothetical protein
MALDNMKIAWLGQPGRSFGIPPGGRVIGWSTGVEGASAKSSAKSTLTRTTFALAARNRSARVLPTASTSGPERGASGMPTMPFWRSMSTRAVLAGSSCIMRFLVERGGEAKSTVDAVVDRVGVRW